MEGKQSLKHVVFGWGGVDREKRDASLFWAKKKKKKKGCHHGIFYLIISLLMLNMQVFGNLQTC